MRFDRDSKIRDVLRHPVGQVLVEGVLQSYRGRMPLHNLLATGRTLAFLEKITSPAFVDFLLDIVNTRQTLVTHSAEGHRPAWWKEAVIYEIFVPCFMDADHDGMGDLAGVMQRLPYLEQLGVDTIWLWSILKADRGAGFVVPPELGSREELQQLCTALHARGMRLIAGCDVAGLNLQLTQTGQTSSGQPLLSYLLPGIPECVPGGQQDTGWIYDNQMGAWLLPLNPGASDTGELVPCSLPAVVTQMLAEWLPVGVDGFCLDTANQLLQLRAADGAAALRYTGSHAGHRLLAELGNQLRQQKDDLLLMGVVQNLGPILARLYADPARGELDLLYHSQVAPPFAANWAQNSATALANLRQDCLDWMQGCGTEQWMALHSESPETGRVLNRVRPNAVYRAPLAKLMATLLLTLRGVPIICQGQELGLMDPEQPGGVRGCGPVTMPWSPGYAGGFTGAQAWAPQAPGLEKVNVLAQSQDRHSVLAYYRALVALRKKNPCLVYGSVNPVFVNNKKVLCYFRILGGEKWYVEVNMTEREITRPARILANQKLVLSNYETAARTLRPFEANLYRC